MFPADLITKAEQLIAAARENDLMLASAESCTGGLLSALLTDISGASKVFDRGFVTYSNEAKMELLGVVPKVLEEHGAVSAETAEEMACGVLEYSAADISVSITGIAGPKSDDTKKPVGLVLICSAIAHGDEFFTNVEECNFENMNRQEVRLATVGAALDCLLSALSAWASKELDQ